MNTSHTGLPFTAAISAIALALAGCSGAKEDAPQPEKEIPSTTDEEQPRSIIREGVDPEATLKGLRPLHVSISFADNGTQLNDDAKAELAKALETPQMKAGGVITLSGHTDSVGTDSANMRVSEQRAKAVQAYLIKVGIAKKRITIIPLGEMRPAAPNALPDGEADEAGRAANRRVDMLVELPPQADAAA